MAARRVGKPQRVGGGSDGLGGARDLLLLLFIDTPNPPWMKYLPTFFARNHPNVAKYIQHTWSKWYYLSFSFRISHVFVSILSIDILAG